MPTPQAGGEAPSGARHAPFARRGEPRRKAVPGDARRHNRALALRTVFRQGPLSRADLARETNLTRVTASDLAAELLAEGLIEELGTRVDQGVGKPATLLGVVPDARLTITVDLSDDERFRAALVDLAGTVLDRRTAAREGRTGPAALALARELCLDLAGVADRPLLGVGVGSPGVVDPRGVVIEAPNRGWHDLDLAAGLGRGLGAPVHVANDANAAALGELGPGGRAGRSLFLVKVGQGDGGGAGAAVALGDPPVEHLAGQVDQRGPEALVVAEVERDDETSVGHDAQEGGRLAHAALVHPRAQLLDEALGQQLGGQVAGGDAGEVGLAGEVGAAVGALAEPGAQHQRPVVAPGVAGTGLAPGLTPAGEGLVGVGAAHGLFV